MKVYRCDIIDVKNIYRNGIFLLQKSTSMSSDKNKSTSLVSFNQNKLSPSVSSFLFFTIRMTYRFVLFVQSIITKNLYISPTHMIR